VAADHGVIRAHAQLATRARGQLTALNRLRQAEAEAGASDVVTVPEHLDGASSLCKVKAILVETGRACAHITCLFLSRHAETKVASYFGIECFGWAGGWGASFTHQT
jgi:hypothetical protein